MLQFSRSRLPACTPLASQMSCPDVSASNRPGRQATGSRFSVFGLPLSVFVAAVVAVLGLGAVAAAPEEPKPSTYAPAKDLVAQVAEFVGRIAEDLADAEAYGEDQKARVAKDANTIVAIAAVLGKHDEDHRLRRAAPRVISAARQLSAMAEEHPAAKQAFDELKQSLESSDGGEAPAETRADLGLLMKQVPIVNGALRRGVDGPRFQRLVDKNAGYASTLAAIAQVSALDRTYCADQAAEQKWRAICAEFRDACADVQRAVRKSDQESAKAALDRVVKTCDACHHEFRDRK